jgi:tetratricopeptide (TPR) repeat protein
MLRILTSANRFGEPIRPALWMILGAMALGLSAPPRARGHADLLLLIDGVSKQIKADPKKADLYLLRGELYRTHADWKSAERDYDRAAQLDSKLAAVELARGKLLFESGRIAEARSKLDRYLVGQPNDVDALVTRAQLLAKLGEYPGAAADYTRAISRSTTPTPGYFLERAKAQAAEGDLANAVQGLDEGLKRLGQLVALQLYAIELECVCQRFDEALIRLETISARSERKEKWLARRGEILLLAKRAEEAQASFTAALDSIESLPSRLRSTPAMVELKKRVGEALASQCFDLPSGTPPF